MRLRRKAKMLTERFITGGPVDSNISIRIGPGARFQQRGEELGEHNGRFFTGGPEEDFEIVARLQLIMLLHEGLYPQSKVVDIGCGVLRGGYWLIHFLNKDCYCGIEPNSEALEAGLEYLLEDEVKEAKKPRFDTNADFDTSVFGEKFDFFFARSIWTHASKAQIEGMLDNFVRDASEKGIFLTSYLRADWLRKDYKGTQWKYPGTTHHSFDWISDVCRKRNLEVEELKEGIYNQQIWLRIAK